jgi:hypothetical protein
MFYEHSYQPVLPYRKWLRRVAKSIGLAVWLAAVSLGIGILGYHYLGALPWVDALLEASMILGGMGPVAPMNNNAVKIFASGYALFSGLMLISTTGILIAPWLHRMLHHFHDDSRHKNRAIDK